MEHAGHEIVKCSCGKIITQCRCAMPGKPVRIVQNGCADCSGETPSRKVDSLPTGQNESTVNSTKYCAKCNSPAYPNCGCWPQAPKNTLSEEDERVVQIALEAAYAGDAGHWPTVAGVLADEVRRLRAAEAVGEWALVGLPKTSGEGEPWFLMPGRYETREGAKLAADIAAGALGRTMQLVRVPVVTQGKDLS